MPRKSMAGGNYKLLMAVETNQASGEFYRVLEDIVTGNRSCDCHAWKFCRETPKHCKHTDAAETNLRLVTNMAQFGSELKPGDALLRDLQAQWPGLVGKWTTYTLTGHIGNEAYYFNVVQIVTPNGDTVRGTVAMLRKNGFRSGIEHEAQIMWAGYGVASELSQRNHIPLPNTPPAHYQPQPYIPVGAKAQHTKRVISLQDLIAFGEGAGNHTDDLQRAEDTLTMFMGPLYTTLMDQHFVDVSSRLIPGCVYRLRRDPLRQTVRNIRIYQHGECLREVHLPLLPGQTEPQHFLAVFLGILSDEAGTFEEARKAPALAPFSDGTARDADARVPAVYRPAA